MADGEFPSLHAERQKRVAALVVEIGARRILDLGCGDGALMLALAANPLVERVVGIELSAEIVATLRADIARLDKAVAAKLRLVHGSMTAPTLAGGPFDVALMVETIEHLLPDHLSRLEKGLFRELAPPHVILTTPNREWNPLLGVPAGRMRHPGHHFEWDREKFCKWSEGVAGRHGYSVRIEGLGVHHPAHGSPSQLAHFFRS